MYVFGHEEVHVHHGEVEVLDGDDGDGEEG